MIGQEPDGPRSRMSIGIRHQTWRHHDTRTIRPLWTIDAEPPGVLFSPPLGHNHGMGARTLASMSLLVPAAVTLVSWLAWRDRLPDEVASHWSDLGAADGTLPTATMFGLTLGISLAAAVAGSVAGRRRGSLFGAGAVGGVTTVAWLVSAGLTLRAGSASDAVLGPWILAVLAGLAYGLVPYLIARPSIEDK